MVDPGLVQEDGQDEERDDRVSQPYGHTASPDPSSARVQTNCSSLRSEQQVAEVITKKIENKNLFDLRRASTLQNPEALHRVHRERSTAVRGACRNAVIMISDSIARHTLAQERASQPRPGPLWQGWCHTAELPVSRRDGGQNYAPDPLRAITHGFRLSPLIPA